MQNFGTRDNNIRWNAQWDYMQLGRAGLIGATGKKKNSPQKQ